MTFIEFFDKTAVENICACLVNVPERVVLLGDKKTLLQDHAQRYERIFADRGHTVDFVCRTVNKNKMSNIVEELCYIVENFEDCVFGLTGGEDLYLTAIGIISERYKDKNIQMHRFNIRNGTISDCDQDGVTIMEGDAPALSVEENIRVYGGDVVYDDVKKGGTYVWDMNEDFREDILKMWSICRSEPGLWNVQMGILETMEEIKPKKDTSLTVTASISAIKERMKRNKMSFRFVKGVFDSLCEEKLLTSYEKTEDILKVTYKNEQVRKCLTKAGQALEMRIYLAAMECTESDGSAVYNDVMNGVSIDWDGQIHTGRNSYDTENEIDVMMMHGVVPVFVSCKNGDVKMEELYKLNSVAQRFGGQHAKKVLVATSLENQGDFALYFRERAKDMNIRLVEGKLSESEAEINRIVKSFWSN